MRFWNRTIITLQNDIKFTEIKQSKQKLSTLRFHPSQNTDFLFILFYFPLVGVWYSGNEFTAGKILFLVPKDFGLQENIKEVLLWMVDTIPPPDS